jgi:NAD(P)-dependent dehydrogenase (short-subunit alcohol dehydrogenase family)
MTRIVVLGAAGIIGQAITQDLAQDGTEIIVADLDLAAAQKLSDRFGPGCVAKYADVTVPELLDEVLNGADACRSLASGRQNRSSTATNFLPLFPIEVLALVLSAKKYYTGRLIKINNRPAIINWLAIWLQIREGLNSSFMSHSACDSSPSAPTFACTGLGTRAFLCLVPV